MTEGMMRKTVNVMGFDFQFRDDGVYDAPINRRINLTEPFYLTAAAQAVHAWELLNGGMRYFVYFVCRYLPSADSMYKFGYSTDPLIRIKSVSADTLLNLWGFDSEPLAHSYESALLYYCRDFKVINGYHTEWVGLTLPVVDRLVNCRSERDLCRFMDIEAPYLRAVETDKQAHFSPKRVVRKLGTCLSLAMSFE